ncbi:MAG: murein L,D-transpeptidase catalytic domain family protein [Gammaproteobacteria bacterium]|nr:murein L,D-transpeptidase catalytic domain family protein [Gammaproteobacteria bacterium]
MRRRPGLIALCLIALAGPARADDRLVSELVAAAPAANPKVLSLAARAADCARKQGLLSAFHHLAVIDYSLPSTQPRLWVFDVDKGRLLFQELVAHGRNTGEKFAEHFSNLEGSRMSSLGLFQTADTYYGNNGYSLRLRGLDAGFNDNALSRAIVMHGAAYVSETIASRLGRLGRSWGCPAVRQEVARMVIDTLKDGALLFAYYPDRKWLAESPMLKCAPDAESRIAENATRPAAPRG